jgi:predicted regulator of Ras-like GTPase activity (Roadblock/LC7/MglB family)
MRAIQTVIEQLSQADNFDTLVLTDPTGLPVATAGDRKEAQALAAVVTEILRVSKQIDTRLELGRAESFALLSHQTHRGVLCRQFTAGDQPLVLAVIVQYGGNYSRHIEEAIRHIQEIWGRPASELSTGNRVGG